MGSATLVPLHHKHGAYHVFDISVITGSSAPVNVAASKVPSGDLPNELALVDDRAPAFALANDITVLV